MTPEGILKKQITDYLTVTGVFFVRMQSGTIRKGSRFIHLCDEGTADILVCRQGILPEWLEIKHQEGKTSKKRQQAQAEFAERVRGLGHGYCICKSVDDVAEFLSG